MRVFLGIIAVTVGLLVSPLAFAGEPTGDPWKNPKATPTVTVSVAPARVALCSPSALKRADDTVGVFQDWLYSDWQLPTSIAHSWTLAVFTIGKGLNCDNQLGHKTTDLYEGLYATYTSS